MFVFVILLLIACAFLFGVWPVVAFVGNVIGFIAVVLLILFTLLWLFNVLLAPFRKD